MEQDGVLALNRLDAPLIDLGRLNLLPWTNSDRTLIAEGFAYEQKVSGIDNGSVDTG